MAVTVNATLRVSFEGAGPTYTSIGGGQGAGNNTDIFIGGSQSGGRRTSNATTHGFFANPGSAANLSGGSTWVKFFMWITHYTALTAAEVRIGSATTAYETHTVTVSEYPPLGGWWPIWVNVDAGTDTGTPDFTNVDEYGQAISLPTVGGNAQNNILDQVHSSTRPVMTWDGSTGSFSSFATTNDSNALGCLRRDKGVFNLFANLQIGSATATTFTSVGAVVLSPDYSHLGSGTTWLGVDIDLQHASTVVTWTDGVYGAADPSTANNKPDLLVTGTSGTADLSRNRFQGLRVASLNSKVTANDCVFAQCGQITLTAAGTTGADIAGSTIQGSTVAADGNALVWNVNADPDGELDNTTHTKGTAAHHAIQFGASSPLTMTLRGWTTSGFNASNGQNDSTIYLADRGSDVTWTINVIGGTGNFSYKKARAGDTVNIVVDPVTTQITVRDAADAPIQNARVLVEAQDGTDDLPFLESVSITRSVTTATVTHTAHGLSSGDKVTIRGAAEQEYNGVFSITVTGANSYTYTVSGSPATPATGTITSTGVVVEGLTNASGIVSSSRTFTVDQAVRIRVRKTPTYEAWPAGGGWANDVVDNVNGLTKTVNLLTE